MQPFTPINNNDKNINKTTSEQYKIDKQISEVIYRQEKSKGNKDDEIDMKIDKRVLFTINDSFSTNQQTKKNDNNITEKKNDNKKENKGDTEAGGYFKYWAGGVKKEEKKK